ETGWQRQQLLQITPGLESTVSALRHPLFLTGFGSAAAIVKFAQNIFLKSPFFGASKMTCVGAICALRTVMNFGAVRISARKPANWLGVASNAKVIVISLKNSSF